MAKGPPDFVIAGAPKCGTTALYARLRRHPGVFMPALKEPHFFSEDIPGLRNVRTEKEYKALFSDAPENALLGEASASYLRSGVAVSLILAQQPSARFIVLLRDPVDAAYAFHSEQLANLNEHVRDFATAWRLQGTRQGGAAISPQCREPELLQYRAVFAYGGQLERLFSLVPEPQRLVILFDELRNDSAGTFRRVSDFLGIGDDGGGGIPRVNESKRIRSRRAALLHRRGRAAVGPLYAPTKRVANAIGIYPSHLMRRWNIQQAPRPPLDPALRNELRASFISDVEQVERLIGRSPGWGAEQRSSARATEGHGG